MAQDFRLGTTAKVKCLCLILISSFLSFNVSANDFQSLPAINVTIDAFSFPPNAHRSEDGRISGRAVETVRRLCEITHMNCQIDFLPTSRAYKNIETGNSDALMTAKIPRFDQCCTFTSWSYPFRAGIIAERPISAIPDTEEEILGETIVMIRGWQSAFDAFPNLESLAKAGKVKVIQVNSIVAAVKMYNAGRASLIWGSDVFEWYFDHLAITSDNRNFKPMISTPAGVLISKKSKNYDEILKRFSLATEHYRTLGNLDEDNFLIPKIMADVYADAPTPN